MRIEIPENLISKLRELQVKQNYSDEVLKSEDAVVMTLGLGDAMYLTFDGRVIIRTYVEDKSPVVASNPKDVYAAIVIGAKVRDTPELLSLLPPRSNDARDCAFCEGEGSGWVSFMMDIHGKPIEMVCAECGGVGWLTRS